jgi:hypothetical protein
VRTRADDKCSAEPPPLSNLRIGRVDGVPSGSAGAVVMVKLPTTVRVNPFVATPAAPSVTFTVKQNRRRCWAIR